MKIMKKFRFQGTRLFALGALCLGLVACAPEKVSISYLAVNHTDEDIVSIVVNGDGGILHALAHGSGGQMCCITLPKQWRPGLTAEIKWQVAGTYQRDAKGNIATDDGVPVVIHRAYKTQTVEVPQYTDNDIRGHFDIHIMPGDKVLVKVSFIYPEHPDYVPTYPKSKDE